MAGNYDVLVPNSLVLGHSAEVQHAAHAGIPEYEECGADTSGTFTAALDDGAAFFWSTGYWVISVGADEEKIKKYVCN